MDELKNLKPDQIKIYKGLKRIREDTADFYLDGVKLSKTDEYRTKSNLLAHIAREIDGGLRDILSPEKEKDITQGKLKNDELGKYKEHKGHIASILTALDTDLNSDIVKEWIDIATQFAKLAHRDSKNRKLRDPSKMEDLWKRYEEVLFWLVGSYYNYLERIDRILEFEEPSEEILNALPSLLKNQAVYKYFFDKLEFPNWLNHLKERGYFDLDTFPNKYELHDHPGTISYPPVMPLFYLRKVAKKNQENPTCKITNTLIEIVDSVIGSYEDIDNKWVDSVILEIISTLPADKIKYEHIEFIRTILKSGDFNKSLISEDIKGKILPVLIKNEQKDLILHLIDIMFDYEIKSEYMMITESLMDKFWLYESMKEFKEPIINLCGIDGASIVLNRIKDILKEYPHFFAIFTIDHPQNKSPKDYECQLISFIRDSYDLSDPQDLRIIVESLIKEKKPLLNRLAIHVINSHYDNLKDLFWNLDKNPLNHKLRHEVYNLLKTNFPSFNDIEIQKLINWIEDVECYISETREYTKSDIDKIEAYEKLRWLDAVKDSENIEIQRIYNHYKKIYPDKIEHPDFDFPIGKPIVVNAVSPEELQVRNNPDEFSRNLEPFLNVSRIRQYDLLYGFIGALNDGKDFEWDGILEFISNIINSEKFWNEKFSGDNYRDWIISAIADMITKKTQNDDNPLKRELLPKICKILLKLANNTNSKLYQMEDVVTSVINSPKGKMFAAMINFSLHYSRLYKKDDEQKWIDPIKKDFSDRLKDPSVEFSVTLGRYLPDLLYLDKKWVIDNINEIFADTNWKETFIGYLLFSNIYPELYETLKKEGHYERAIYTDFEDEIVNEKLVDHVCIAYLYDMDDINDNESLIHKLIHNRNQRQLRDIVRSFLDRKDRHHEKIKSKIKPLWRVLFNLVSKNPEDKKEFISYISGWLVFFDEIDNELFEWLTLSSKYLKIKSNHILIVENLLNCVEKSPKEVAEIYIEMLNNGAYPDYEEENIQKIVETLFIKGYKDRADKICNMYGEKNIHLLRGVYKKFNEFS